VRPALALLLLVVVTGCAPLAARATAPDEAGGAEGAGLGPDLAAPVAGPAVLVHIESTDVATLVRLDEDYNVVERCTSPCDRAMPLAGTYRIDAPTLRSSWGFRLASPPEGRVVLRVSPSSRAAYGSGKTLGTAGMIAGGVGLGVALAGAVVATSDADANNGARASCPACTVAFVGGASLMVAGIGLGIAGLVLVLSNLSSGVSQSPGPAAP
jgi:hypothetical protein